MSFTPQANWRPEPMIERLSRFRLVTFDGALYTLNRGTGQMLRFDLTSNGFLDQPYRAASAVKNGDSMVRQGVLVPAGRILVVLSPSSTPTLESLEAFGLLNFVLTKLPTAKALSDITQDLVYNPQQDHWIPCGHGLTVDRGDVAAFRGGDSKRLWVVNSNRKVHTLKGAFEHFFAPEYIEAYSPKVLPRLLDGKREVTIVNHSGVDLVSVDDECRALEIDNINSNSLAALAAHPGSIPLGGQKTLTVMYNQSNPGTVKLHYLAVRSIWPKYLLEVTLSGAGLSTVSSVFKRVASDGRVAEFPETLANHAAGQPIVVPRAARLIEKSTLFIMNSTTHLLDVKPALGIFQVSDIKQLSVGYDTPRFEISVSEIDNAKAAVTFDFAMPQGIEMSPGGEAQKNLIRISTDSLHMLDLQTTLVKAGSPFEFARYDATRAQIPAQSENVYACILGMKTRKEIDAVRLGDPVFSPDGNFLYMPLAKPGQRPDVGVWRADCGEFSFAGPPSDAGGNFSVPNSVSASRNKLFAMFGGTTLHETASGSVSVWTKKSFGDYVEVGAFAASGIAGDVFLVAKKLVWVGAERLPDYFLVIERASGTRTEVALDKITHPVVGPPMAVSPDGRTVAIGHNTGFLVIDVEKAKIEVVRLTGAREAAFITFSPDGEMIYCAHMTRVIGANPRRTVAGRDLTISRAHTKNPNNNKTISIPNVEANFSLTGNTRQSFGVGVQSKEQVAFTLAPSPDSRSLYVSAGTAILKVDALSFDILPWSTSVELPCRLVQVRAGWGKAWKIYAMGSYYEGDGTSVNQYKTQLYAIPAPKR